MVRSLGIEFHTKQMTCKGEKVNLNIWDNTVARPMIRHSAIFVRSSVIIMLMYSFSDDESLNVN